MASVTMRTPAGVLYEIRIDDDMGQWVQDRLELGHTVKVYEDQALSVEFTAL